MTVPLCTKYKASSMKTWCDQLGVEELEHRTLTLTLLVTFGMNWNAGDEPGVFFFGVQGGDPKSEPGLSHPRSAPDLT